MNFIRPYLICLLLAGLSLGCNTDKESRDGTVNAAYDACEGLECGASCDPCVPGEACSGEEIATQCNADGQCVPAPTVQCEVSDLCEGVTCPMGETFCQGDTLYTAGASACNPETGMCEPVLGPEPRNCRKELMRCDTDYRGSSTGVYDCVDCGLDGCLGEHECVVGGLTCGESCGNCDSDDPSCRNPEVERFCTLWGECRVHAQVCAPDAVEITACAGPAATASFSHIWRTGMPLIQGDYLALRVHQTGVCADDEFVACYGDFMQTTQDETPFIEPMRVALSLNLTTDREDCDEEIVRDVFIDLAGLRETYRQQHPNGAHFFYVVLPDGETEIAVPAASTPDMVSPREPVGGVPSVEATVRVVTAWASSNGRFYPGGNRMSGVTITRDGQSVTTDSAGWAILPFPRGPYRLRLESATARPHTVWGVASNFSFEYVAYVTSEMNTESFYSSLGLIDDPTRGILVVRLQVGANVSIDAEHGPAFVITRAGPVSTQTIPSGLDLGHGFGNITFPNVAPGLVNIETTFPQGRCRIFPAETNDRTVEVVAGEVTLVDFVCRLDP